MEWLASSIATAIIILTIAASEVAWVGVEGFSRPGQSHGHSTNSSMGEAVKLGTISVAPIAFGTLNLPFTTNDAKEILRSLPYNTLLDTAEIYGPSKRGEVEQLIGSLSMDTEGGDGNLDKPSISKDFFVATKFAPKPWRVGPESVVASCNSSIKRLNCNSIDLYQIHYPDPGLVLGKKDDKYWEGVAECYHSGLVKNIGMCNYGPTMIQRAHQALTVERNVPIVSNQINFNLMRFRSSIPTKRVCDELGIKVIGYHPLGNGVLTGRYTNVDEKVKELSKKDSFAPGLSKLRRVKWYQKHCDPVIDTVQRVALQRSVPCAQVCINWSLSKGVIPLTGVTNVTQMKEILLALEWQLTDKEISRLDASSNNSAEYAMGFELI